jgi:hypothetical protein
MKYPPPPNYYYATILNVLGLGLLLWMLLLLSHKCKSSAISKACQIILLGFLLFPMEALRLETSQYFPVLQDVLAHKTGSRAIAVGVFICIAMAMLVAFMCWRTKVVTAMRFVLLVLFPLVPMNLGQAVWRAVNYDAREFLDKPSQTPLNPSSRVDLRAVWIIFDELDQRLVFDERPDGINLPEFDWVKAHGVCASNAHPPRDHIMESLIMGKSAEQVVFNGPDDLQIVDSTVRVSWKDQPSIFSRALALGYNTALVGWYHPYCRVLGPVLTRCYWCEMPMQYNSLGTGISELLVNQLRSLFETNRLSPFGQALPIRAQAEHYRLLMDEALDVAADPSLGLILIHLPVPHDPYFYNRRTRQFDLVNSPATGYLDSLELADISLGAIRKSMENHGLWDCTTVLVSSDHSLRSVQAFGGKRDRRVPFLLKLAKQHSGLRYDSSFNTIVTQDLLLSVLRQEIPSPDDVLAWLDRHRDEDDAHRGGLVQ